MRIRRLLIGRPIPVDTVDARVGEPLPGALDGGLPIRMPLRHGKAQAPIRNDRLNAGQRRIDANSDIDQQRPSARGARLRRLAGARAGVRHRYEFPRRAAPLATSRDMHSVQQMCCGARRAAPVVRHPTVREMIVTSRGCTAPRSRMNSSRSSAFFRRAAGQGAAFGRDTTVRARMHQSLQGLRYEAIVDEKILLDTELWVAAFEIAGTIASHSMSQHQVLSARRRTNRVRLHKAQPIEGTLQSRWLEQTASDCKAPEVQKVLIRRFRTSIFIAALGRRCSWMPISPCILRPAVSSSMSVLITRPLIN